MHGRHLITRHQEKYLIKLRNAPFFPEVADLDVRVGAGKMKLARRGLSRFFKLGCAYCTNLIWTSFYANFRKSLKYSKEGSCILQIRVQLSQLSLISFPFLHICEHHSASYSLNCGKKAADYLSLCFLECYCRKPWRRQARFTSLYVVNLSLQVLEFGL